MGKYQNKINRTDQIIEDSFLNLLKRKPLNKVSINEICDLSQINRSTFYRHFEDKYQVLDKIEKQLVSQLSSISKNKFENSTSVSNLAIYLAEYIDLLLDVIRDNQFVLEILLSDNGDSKFRSILRKLFSKRMMDSWSMINGSLKANNNGVNTELAIEFIVASDMAIIEYMVSNPKVTHEQIKKTFSQLLIKGPLNTLHNSIVE